MTRERLYTDRADLYDLVYQWKDFSADATRIHELLAAEGVPDGARLLDAACGTGTHLALLAEWYDVSGFDGNEGMLAVARRKLSDVPLFQADFETFAVTEPFDVVTCLFSSIGYVIGEEALRRAAACFVAAVRPGGVLILEPWFEPEAWAEGKPTAQAANSPEVSVARVTRAGRTEDVATCEMHYLVARRGQPMESFVEKHRLWLCPHETLVRVFDDAGFDAGIREVGLMEKRGLLVGRRR